MCSENVLDGDGESRSSKVQQSFVTITDIYVCVFVLITVSCVVVLKMLDEVCSCRHSVSEVLVLAVL